MARSLESPLRTWRRGASFWAPLAFLPLLVGAPASFAGSVQVPVYFGLQPGSATKAEVDLTLGEPRSRGEEAVYDYAPPPSVSDTARVRVTFFPDTMRVARLDVYLTAPLDPEPLRPTFGNRVMERDRPGGGREEIFYPRLHALVFDTKAEGASASAISYLSPRFVADLFVDRFDESRRAGRPEEARTEADKAVIVDPDYARGYIAQGEWLEAKESYDEAIVRYIAGTNAKYSPRAKAQAHVHLGMLYGSRKGWLDKAEAELKSAVAFAPGLAFAHVSYGQFLQKQKRADEALACFARAIEIDPNDVDAHLGAADVHWTRGEYAKARPHLEAAERWLESPAGAQAGVQATVDLSFLVYFRLAYCIGEANEPARALEIYAKAARLRPKDAAVLNNMASAYNTLGKPDEAVRKCREGLAVAPNAFFLHKTMGRALLALGQLKEALRAQQAALALRPDDPRQLFEVARAWAALHKKKEALAWLDKAVAAGLQCRSELLSDPQFEWLRRNGDFKKLLARTS